MQEYSYTFLPKKLVTKKNRQNTTKKRNEKMKNEKATIQEDHNELVLVQVPRWPRSPDKAVLPQTGRVLRTLCCSHPGVAACAACAPNEAVKATLAHTKVLSIYLYKRGLSVCLFVCLFGFEAQTTGWISSKKNCLFGIRNWSPNYWMDLSQIWHGPHNGPCRHTWASNGFFGGARGGIQ